MLVGESCGDLSGDGSSRWEEVPKSVIAPGMVSGARQVALHSANVTMVQLLFYMSCQLNSSQPSPQRAEGGDVPEAAL